MTPEEASAAETPVPSRLDRFKSAAKHYLLVYTNKYTWMGFIVFFGIVGPAATFFSQNWSHREGAGFGTFISLFLIAMLAYILGRLDVHDDHETARRVKAYATPPVEEPELEVVNNVLFFQSYEPPTDGAPGNLWIKPTDDRVVEAFVLSDEAWVELDRTFEEEPHVA